MLPWPWVWVWSHPLCPWHALLPLTQHWTLSVVFVSLYHPLHVSSLRLMPCYSHT
jgi:hypothetical protein